ncbi:MAG: DNA translocase FtsK 4TM domain-containing protein [Deltaproteobacteria bacterium]|jgi:S-DNA-T family DNA segregation ATPase FtsK/SpoIIIE|nr:DNA translocase FtsK 4TM domain-containing protein [Deltaproteobacteria bacterium]
MPRSKAKPKKSVAQPLFASKLPAEVPGLIALLLSVLVVLALISYSPDDESNIARNYVGVVGFAISRFLVKYFGALAFWPAPILFWLSYYVLKNPAKRVSPFTTIVGVTMTLLALLALAGLIWPDGFYRWSKATGGGLLGAVLAHGLTVALGRVGAFVVTPFLALGGVTLFTGFSPASLVKLGAIFRFLAKILSGFKIPAQPDPTIEIKPPKGGRVSQPSEPAPQKNSEPEPLLLTTPVEEKPSLVIREKRKKVAPIVKDAPPKKTGPVGEYEIPPLDLLDQDRDLAVKGLTEDEVTANARLLEKKLKEFQVEGQVIGVSWGPVITQYEFKPAPGIKIGKVTRLAEDLTMALKTSSCRVAGVIPGKGAIGLELPNPNRQLVTLREVVESPEFVNSPSPLSLALGVDITGQPVVRDLIKTPHLLIAGATGSGKSVCLDSLIMSIFFKATPLEARFLLIDPKRVELAQYQDLPHLLYPVLTDPEEATVALKWAVAEMETRYKLMAEKGARHIAGYNELIKAEIEAFVPKSEEPSAEPPKTLPYLVIVIDELSDLMLTAPKDVETSITRLAAKARAAGIHLILATQRPSVDVLTGVIKANLPTRISFQVATKIDSRTILDRMGAEQLLGKGDMLFQSPGANNVERLHGAFVSDAEKKRVTDYLFQFGPPDYLDDLTPPERDEEEGGGDRDEKYQEALEMVRRTGKASISLIQRHLRIGYNRAARIIEDMERDGYIGPQDGAKPRIVLFS